MLGLVPIIIMTLAVYVLLYGPPYIGTTDWVLDSYKLHYMDAAVDPDNYAKARLIKEAMKDLLIACLASTSAEPCAQSFTIFPCSRA